MTNKRINSFRPHTLSIHPTMQCDYHCVGCYLKKDIDKDAYERKPDFFIELVKVAKEIGMKEVAIPVNFVKNNGQGILQDPMKEWETIDKNLYYYLWIKEACQKNNIDFSITCNYDFFTNYPDINLDGIKLISVSLNDFVTSTPEKKKECLEVMKKLKQKIPVVNCNLLLSDHLVKLLNKDLMEEILSISDTVYLLVSKPIRIPLEKVAKWFSDLAEKFEIGNDRILIDTCVKYAFGLTNGICDKHQMIYVNPYGEVKFCSFDSRNLTILKNPTDLKTLYNKVFPMELVDDCKLMGM